MTDDTIRRAATARGLVQGVSFRWYTRQEAERLGVSGWVRNQPDGTVRLEAEGPRPAVDALLDWVAHGPPHARVAEVVVEEQSVTGASAGFTILH